jgi:hypothetical protein
MMKHFLFVAALLSLAFAGGCATGGSGPCASNCAAVTVEGESNGISPIDITTVGLPITFTATVMHTSQTAVNWTITGTSCSSSASDKSNPCGYFTSVTSTSANYQGPSSIPSTRTFSVVATLQSDSAVSGSVDMTIIPITTAVAPTTPNVGLNLQQQFTAVALPDQLPQTFNWTCTSTGGNCANFHQDPNVSGLAYYTASSNEECGSQCVKVTAFSTLDPTGSGCSFDTKHFPCTVGQATVVTSRMEGTYAFRFSGFDGSGKPVMVAGNFIAGTDGTISSGVEDVLTSSGPHKSVSITGGGYVANSSDPNNSNNAGTLKLLPQGAYPYQFRVVLDGAGDVQMIESDSNGTGSGVAEVSSKKFNGSKQNFAFGFTGVDSSNRVGYAGLLETDGVSNVTGGLIDVNDGGNTTNSVCNLSAAPCNVTGSYVQDGTFSGMWHLTLTSPIAMVFDFFIANGGTSPNSPLTLYAISTDSNPAVLGSIVLQNSKITTYNNAAFAGTSVSALIGANNNVSLTLGTTDGTSGGTGGTGGFAGTFDWNNDGTMVSVPSASPCPGGTVCDFTYTYVATNNNLGRYVFQMLGNPNASPAVPPLPFILYATGANSGFLLDQSSPAVIAGTMNSQTGPPQNPGGAFANSSMTGTFALATNGDNIVTQNPVTMNLLLTSPGSGSFNVTGTEDGNPADVVTGTYNVQGSGVGSITLTKPGAANYIIYGVDGTHFYLIENATKDAGAVSPLLFMEQ